MRCTVGFDCHFVSVLSFHLEEFKKGQKICIGVDICLYGLLSHNRRDGPNVCIGGEVYITQR